MESFMQYLDDNIGDYCIEDFGIDRLDFKNVLYVIGFQNGGVCGWKNVFIG